MATQYYSSTNIITWAKGSQAYACRGEAKKLAFKGLSPSEDLDMKLYCARLSLEWQVDQNPTDNLVYELADYIYALSFPYVLEAMQATGGGTTPVTPIPPSPITGSTLNFIELTKSKFSNATDYIDDRLSGKDLSVIGSWLGSRLLEPGIEWEFIGNDTFRILTDGFDSSVFDDNTIIARIDINGEISAGVTASTFTYDLSTNATPITSLASGTPYQIRNVVVKPNGYTYTWGTEFKFTDNWPEQPLAIDADTKQIYTFMYIAGVGDVCVGQSLNIAL